MVLLRRVIGDTLRARRQAQHRTLREVSTAANVSLGYLSEIERGQKEASSELLAAVCGALGADLSDVLREVSHSVAAEERLAGATTPARRAVRAEAEPEAQLPVPAMRPAGGPPAETVVDNEVSVTVRRHSPLRTTLLARRHGRARDVVGSS